MNERPKRRRDYWPFRAALEISRCCPEFWLVGELCRAERCLPLELSVHTHRREGHGVRLSALATADERHFEVRGLLRFSQRGASRPACGLELWGPAAELGLRLTGNAAGIWWAGTRFVGGGELHGVQWPRVELRLDFRQLVSEVWRAHGRHRH